MKLRHSKIALSMIVGAGLIVTACGDPADEFRAAVPNRTVLQVDMPEAMTTDRGLIAEQHQSIVGGPADYYTMTYYESRKINAFGKFVIDILEEVTAYPPTTIEGDMAVWGPFSDDNEPNEFRLVVERVEIALLHYRWVLQGKHKSAADDAYVNLAAGALEPDGEDDGRGWFVVSFTNIRTLDPTEDGDGLIAYGFVVDEGDVNVRVLFEGPDDQGVTTRAGYAYGKRAAGDGFILFALPEDIDHGEDGKVLKESLLIRTRWAASNAGRADVVATNGDLEDNILHVTQCWDGDFTSTYEGARINGVTLTEDGDVNTCRITTELVPVASELPSSAEELASPHATLMQ